ncbi:uncharacterized protein TRUGW13939_04939 [Talaromyces rugulosus]|uniref:Alpha/beta hydrolase fold-3 domain-containing protein n=1 Tax=Talaromyces rugulosus TaxID=121627 RepID=A0A7H8QV11_TALRU|nr:uncharacterized protein TRUGW13939_04939 [Talaromyces rugulosus]QKX57819.1 hypothetical protein TRUGW13939_04939 [Talaromyces rugulosus]
MTTGQPTPLQSDVVLDESLFQANAIHSSTLALNKWLVEQGKQEAKWWETGASAYRDLRATGKTVHPAPVLLPQASQFFVPSRDPSRTIMCRMFRPAVNGLLKGLFLHIHGGGYVLGSATGQDLMCDHIANNTQLLVVSIEYRLAPEYCFPAAAEDCQDVADWMVLNSKRKFGVEMNFIGGESAGATLSSDVLIHLRGARRLKNVKGAILNYGCFDLSLLPSARLSKSEETPILGYSDLQHFFGKYLPEMTIEDRKLPSVSPAYNELSDLVPALFIVGTEDALIDDTVLMHSRWRRAGNPAVLKYIPGGCHGFMVFDGNEVEVARQGWKLMIHYLRQMI